MTSALIDCDTEFAELWEELQVVWGESTAHEAAADQVTARSRSGDAPGRKKASRNTLRDLARLT
jgi:hypothetical protein